MITLENTLPAEVNPAELRPEAIKEVKVELDHIRGRTGLETGRVFASFGKAAQENGWTIQEMVQATLELQKELGGNLEIVVKPFEGPKAK